MTEQFKNMTWKDLLLFLLVHCFDSVTSCNGGFCSSLVHYPIVGSSHYSEFNVPALPTDIANCYYIYYNIDWQPAGPPSVKQAMNQFVPQLMLGEALDDSSNAPHYLPRWHNHKTWVFGAQYFFALVNHSSPSNWTGHTATGELIHVKPGDVS